MKGRLRGFAAAPGKQPCSFVVLPCFCFCFVMYMFFAVPMRHHASSPPTPAPAPELHLAALEAVHHDLVRGAALAPVSAGELARDLVGVRGQLRRRGGATGRHRASAAAARRRPKVARKDWCAEGEGEGGAESARERAGQRG